MYTKFVQLLQEKDITAYRVSKDTGISQSTLSNWKTGRAKPKIDKILILSKYFNVPIDFFVSTEDK